jgi:hypothetical protein
MNADKTQIKLCLKFLNIRVYLRSPVIDFRYHAGQFKTRQ